MKNLNSWLNHLEKVHTGDLIDLGLERIQAVRDKIDIQPRCPIITVGGTNGKGSVCAFLTSIYHEASYKVGTLTSPHLLKFNERICINGVPVSDELIVEAFDAIEKARSNISLTYFEFNTLAAVYIFDKVNVDIMILEVGLGGRLDAVNIFDADCSVITSVDLDHQNYLGDTIEKVAFEKAGIFRSGKPVVCGQNPVPKSMIQYADEIDADLYVIGKDFELKSYGPNGKLFKCNFPQSEHILFQNMLKPSLEGIFQYDNLTTALAVITCLQTNIPVTQDSMERGLTQARNIGRFQLIKHAPQIILDVGHNPHAAQALRKSLHDLPMIKTCYAVFSMLCDKDIESVLEVMSDQIDEWLIAPLYLPRGMEIKQLFNALKAKGIKRIRTFDNVSDAYKEALALALENDRIIAFGSFHTVAEVMALLEKG